MSGSICVFGDSIMKGVAYDAERSKYIYLNNSFANDFVYKTGITVDNFAKFGCTLSKGIKIIERLSSQLGKYKFIALEFGGNDCDFLWPEIAKDPSAQHLPNTPIDTFETLYTQIIDKLLQKGYRPVLFSLPPLVPDKYFRWVSKGVNSENILKWLGDVDFIYRWQELYSISVSKIASSKGVPLIDIRSAFLRKRNYENLICADGIHPNEEGHKLILDTITNIMPSDL